MPILNMGSKVNANNDGAQCYSSYMLKIKNLAEALRL